MKPIAGEHPESSATHSSIFVGLNAPARDAAWLRFHARYEPVIAAFARRMGARPQDVADVVQEVLLGFFKASSQFAYDRTRGRFRAYLKVSTSRAVRAKLAARGPGEGRAEPLDELAMDAALDDVLERDKLERAIRRVREDCSKRPDRVRTFRAFELTVILERPVAEVAAELDMSVASVHQAKTRISKAIKAAMDEDDIDDPA